MGVINTRDIDRGFITPFAGENGISSSFSASGSYWNAAQIPVHALGGHWPKPCTV